MPEPTEIGDRQVKRLASLEDVDPTGLLDGDALAWDFLSGRFKPVPVIRKLWANVMDKQFGAINDGQSHPLSERYGTNLVQAQLMYPDAVALTDQIDHCAIQKAMSMFKNVYLPEGDGYICHKALDGTNNDGQFLRGDGQTASVLYYQNSGGGMLDLSGSEYSGTEDLSFVAFGSQGPDWGIQVRRTTAKNYCQLCNFSRTKIQMAPRSTGNNGLGTIAFYNCAAELFQATRCHFLAWTPLVDCGTNVANISSLVDTLL